MFLLIYIAGIKNVLKGNKKTENITSRRKCHSIVRDIYYFDNWFQLTDMNCQACGERESTDTIYPDEANTIPCGHRVQVPMLQGNYTTWTQKMNLDTLR